MPSVEGRLIASSIEGAQFVEVESKNHILLAHELASPREREVLGLLSEGLDNAQIAVRLDISEKTVRNHVSSVYDKLGVWSRAQAVVFARERGFRR